MRRRTITLIILFAIFASAPGLHSAEEADDEATKLFELANGLYVRPAFHEQAVVQYREFLRRYPEDSRCDDATFFLGNCLRKLGRYEEALQAFLDHQRFKGSPRRDEANLRTGQVCFSLGKYPEATRYFLKVHNKRDVEENLANSSGFWLGWAYLKNNQPKEAIPVLTKLAQGKENPLVPWANFHLGYAYRATGGFEKAIERFQKAATTLSERKAESLFMIGESYVNLKRYSRAYAAYKELVEKHPESPFRGRAAFGAVWSLYSDKDYDRGIEAYAICQKVIPKDSQAEATYILANCYFETKQLKEAWQTYQRVSKDYPKSPFVARADYKACWCLFLQDKFDEVIASGTEFVKDHPTYGDIANIHFLLGESLYERNRIREARSHYQTVIAQHPQSTFFEDASFKLGECQLKEGLLEEARKTFRDFAAAHPTNQRAVKALAKAAECGLELASKAKPKLQQAQYEEVARDYKALYEAVVKKDPKSALAGETLYQLGVTYVRLNKRDDMTKAFQKLVEAYPKNQYCAEAYYWLASESEKAKDYEKAIDYFNRSLKLKPKGLFSKRAKRRLADVYFLQDDKEKAAGLIVELLRSDPQSDVAAQTHLWTGEFLLEKGNYNEAIEMYDLFLKKFKGTPRVERAYYGLGDCYFKQGQWQKAIENFAKAIDFKGESISLSRLYSGIAHLKLGRNKQAEGLLREVERSGGRELEAKAIYWLGTMHFDLAQGMKTREEKLERYNLARKEYIKVVILYNTSEVRPECMYRVAECLEQEGLTKDSKKQLEDLIKEYPDDAFGKRASEKLGTAPVSGGGQ